MLYRNKLIIKKHPVILEISLLLVIKENYSVLESLSEGINGMLLLRPGITWDLLAPSLDLNSPIISGLEGGTSF